LEQKTKNVLNITFPIIPGPNRKTAEAFGVWNSAWNYAIATVILDKTGVVRYVHKARGDHDRPTRSEILNKLKEINQSNP